MKFHLPLLFTAAMSLSGVVLPSVALAQAPPIRILPLGDSITDGSAFDSPDGSGGYRKKLFADLTALGYNVDSIGTLTINSGLLPVAEKEHEGHSGWRIDQLDTPMEGWLAGMEDPDVVLMHIGTNDFGQGFNTGTAINRLDALILKIATLRPYAHIIVTNLMVRGEPQNTAIQTSFNPQVPDLVLAHAAAGRRVTFLDMRSKVLVTDMGDNPPLHPNQVGYDKMSDAWLEAIQAVIGPNGDDAIPAISKAAGVPDRTHVTVTFSKPVADAAAVPENFTINGGVTVSAASLDASKRVVTLTTSLQSVATTYTVTVNGVQDRITPTPNTIAANSTVNFNAAIPRGYLNNVPESAGYTLACTLDVPAIANYGTANPTYIVDNRGTIGTFDRIAYYVELQTATGDLQYLWTSMNAFTTDLNKIAVPTVSTAAIFQQGVTNMNVVSNVAGVVNGSGITTGNIEFWPSNYSQPNGAVVPGASDGTYDFGDTRTVGTYGSMQVHNSGAAQTLFAFNNWGGTVTAVNADLGIGAGTTSPDWTFANNAGNYTVKQIQVLVRNTSDFTAPTATSAVATFSRTGVRVTFSEPVSAASVAAQNFSLNGGVTVLGATLSANLREVQLTTTTQPPATALTLTLSGVRDTSPNANRIAPGTTIPVTAAALPPEIIANVGAPSNNYQLVYSLNVPITGNLNALGASAYSLDERAAAGTFTRIAYYLELQKPGLPSEYVWVSADAFSTNRGKIGVPTAANGVLWQRNLTNMEVVSNVAGVVNGSGIATGNIEFWPSNYAAARAAGSPANASATLLDFGDSGAATTAGHGSMQIHNSDLDGAGAGTAGQTLFAINNFGVDGQALAMGIGSRPTNDPDWTFAANGSTYSKRVLHVLVLPGTTAPAGVVANVPEAANYQLAATVQIPATGNLNNATIYGTSDVRADLPSFSRIAYYLELKKPADATSSFVWTSMDAFTTDVTKIGVPTTASGAVWQQNVANLNVFSNVAGVVTGTGITTGNIEFWPSNYTQARAAVSPLLASSGTYDFGDSGAGTAAGHGSMQVHNYDLDGAGAGTAGQTLLAINGWGSTSSTTNKFGLGIGNSASAGDPDWTFAGNSDLFSSIRVLHVFVLPASSDSAGPTFTRAVGSTTLNRLVVTFNEPLADVAATAANFSISGGLTVTGARMLPGNRDIALTTSAQTPGTLYTVSATGIRDRSPNGNLIAGGANAAFTAYTPPAALANVPVSDSTYKLIYRLAIPTASGRWNVNDIPYGVDEAKYGEQLFDRVAYLMELDGNWAYASFDPFTNVISKTGVPTSNVSATPFQQKVTAMNVASNVGGIAVGSNIATGNIEFWGGNYDAINQIAIPNASASLFDFGDRMTAGVHGTMQIHNHDVDGAGAGVLGQTIFAYNNWGSNVATSDVGIGNNPNAGTAGVGGTQAPDWTFTGNAGTAATKNLYVLVRNGGTATGAAPVLASHPASRLINVSGSTTFAINATGAASYQWRKGGIPIPDATNPWLDLTNVTAAAAGSYDVVVTGPTLVTTTSLAATLTINSPPTFSGYSFGTFKDTAATVLRPKILARAADAIDGDALSLTSVSAASTAGGTVVLNASSVVYTPPAGFTGSDSFTVTITDARTAFVTGTVNVTVGSGNGVGANQSSLTLLGNGSVEALFFGIPGRSYLIQRSTDLQSWTNLGTISAAANGMVSFNDPDPPEGTAFYRTKEAP